MRYVCEERWYTRGMQTLNGGGGAYGIPNFERVGQSTGG